MKIKVQNESFKNWKKSPITQKMEIQVQLENGNTSPIRKWKLTNGE